MAFFNVPVRHPDHAPRAVSAATRVLLAVPQINAQVAGREVLRVGIAVASGWAMSTRMGSGSCRDYTLVGDTVNLASRLQGQAGAGEILATEEVYATVQAAFPNAQRREWQLKGIPQPVVGYVLT